MIYILSSIALLLLACTERRDLALDKTNALCVGIATFPEIDSLKAPQLMQGLGTAHLDIGTPDDSTQLWFNQGLNLLHGFWYIEAFRAFREVLKRDSTQAMGWWGMAMCMPGFGQAYQERFVEAASKAQKYKHPLNPMLQDMIDASTILVSQGIEAAQEPYRALYEKYPNEAEVIAMSSIMLRMDKSEQSQQEVIRLLEKGLEQFPEHTALLHYYIHVKETHPTDYIDAIEVAESLIELAPQSPHLIHMAGHLYFLQGEYQLALDVFQQCLDIEENWHQKEGISRVYNQNYLHNLHFMALCESELDHKEAAMKYAEKYASVSYRAEESSSSGNLMLLYEGRILPALLLIRFREYEEAANKIEFWLQSPVFPLEDETVRSYLSAMYYYCKGMEAITNGRAEDATNAGMKMTRAFQAYEEQALKKQGQAAFKLINEIHDIISMARYELAGWIDNYKPSQPYSDYAWSVAIDLQSHIEYDEPPRLMYPIQESLARLHWHRGDSAAMEKAKTAALQYRPKSKLIQRIGEEVVN